MNYLVEPNKKHKHDWIADKMFGRQVWICEDEDCGAVIPQG